MKILLLLLLIPVLGNAQKLEVNEVDKFTKQKRLETNNAKLKAGMSEGVVFKIRTVDSTVFISFQGYGAGAQIIGPDDKVILLLEDQSTVTLTSTGLQSIIVERMQNKFHHQYSSSVGDLIKLKGS